jgi:hypothetical protein
METRSVHRIIFGSTSYAVDKKGVRGKAHCALLTKKGTRGKPTLSYSVERIEQSRTEYFVELIHCLNCVF